jgi:hypothetical protein
MMPHLFRVSARAAFAIAFTLCATGPSPAHAATNPDRTARITTLDIAPVWSGSPVGFSLLTQGGQQYVAFYDAERRMSVAQRTLGERRWHITVLPSTLGWDSHNYITLALDPQGYLHLAGNMHTVPLVYFRSTRPHDASSLTRVPAMTGQRESSVTYPVFSHLPDGTLLFEYRDGRSGSGDTIIDRYNDTTRTWSRFTDQPLFAGGGHGNAYPLNPVLGPDGWYHLSWVWRETPMAETNRDLSYARSRDRIHWETAAGEPIALPLTVATPGLVVDPVPPRAGLINGGEAIGFDATGHVVISYIKYDAAGNTQLYFARLQNGLWSITQATDWHYRWDFHGGGTLVNEVHVGALRANTKGQLTIALQHKLYGSGTWTVDPSTLHLGEKVDTSAAPAEIDAAQLHAADAASPDALQKQTAGDSGDPVTGGLRYHLEWFTLPQNRDQPRTGPLPPPSTLRLIITDP